MTRMSRFVITIFLVALSLISGCTNDPMGLRPSYKGRIVPPGANTQPISNPPIAVQPGGQLGQPVTIGQSVILPQAALSNMALAQNRLAYGNRPFPMLASAGGQFDGRAYPLLSREARIPRSGGAQTRKMSIRNTAMNTAITTGLPPTPQEDLRYHGGHTIRDLKYMNIYVGGDKSWDTNDWKSIDKALAASMADRRLNNVIMQYFGNKPVSSTFLGSSFLNGWKPKFVAKNDLESQVQNLYRQHALDGQDFPNTVFNFMLPRSTVLADPSGGQQSTVVNKAIPHEEAEDSTGGLGGYHGSVHIDGKTIYYAVGVYSERLPSGKTNGIPVFDQNWKNVVGTFYHELQEARTDADVDDASETSNGINSLGWTSDSGLEIGDYPIAEAQQLFQVFKEVPLADGSGNVPIQLQYSNAVHGPEGPIEYPHGMEPAPGTIPANPNPTPNPTPSNNNPGIPADLTPELQRLIQQFEHAEDYLKKAVLKLLS